MTRKMIDDATLLGGPQHALDGFGRAVGSSAAYYEPGSVDELRGLLGRAADERVPVTLRGAGRSYGDASLNGGAVVIGTERLSRVLAFDRDAGTIDVEPGVTIEDIWRATLDHGWWPEVVPGTMAPTVGGCVAMNVHGKNHFSAGPLGDHVHELDLLTMDGRTLTCSPTQNTEIFRAVIGGFGVLGVVTRARVGLRRLASGLLEVEGLSTANLDETFDAFEAREADADYLVAWIDAFAKGKRLGRSAIHAARYLTAADDPDGAKTLSVAGQDMPDRFFGVIPRGAMWRLMAPWTNDVGMRLVNTGKFVSSRLFDGKLGGGKRHTYRQPIVPFQFLLDYVPRWREAYGKSGFIQVQPFLPVAQAREGFRRILALCQDEGLPSYLAVFKRHRPDQFLLTHALDGYSLAMDFRVNDRNRQRVWALGQAIGDIVVELGGRFYFAKDAVARADQVRASFGDQRIETFLAHKRALDPEGVLSSELSRRVLPDLPVVGR